MTPQKTEVHLRHMLEHAREAMAFAQGRTRADLDADRLLNLGLVHLLEIVGEAAARVPPGDRQQMPAIAWPQIVAMRIRLIHGYDVVDFDILWSIILTDLPPLVEELERILGEDAS